MQLQSPLPSPPLSPSEDHPSTEPIASIAIPATRKRARSSSYIDPHATLRIKNLCTPTQHEPSPDQHSCISALRIAVQHRRLDHVARLLPLVTVTRSLIKDAILSGAAPILRLLLQHYPSRDDGLALLAVFWNRIECLRVLIAAGFDVNPISKEPIYTAVQQRKIDMVCLLCEAGADPCQSNGHNPSLLYAANHGFVDMIPLLMTPTTSKACVQQALLASEPLGHHVSHVILRSAMLK